MKYLIIKPSPVLVMTCIFKKFIPLIFSLSILHICPTASAQSLNPTLTFVKIGSEFRIVSGAKTVILHSETYGGDLFIKCEAPYPIQWTFVGYFSPREVAKIQPPKLNGDIYEIAIYMYFLDAKIFPSMGSSLQLSCVKTDDHDTRDDTFIFVKGNFKTSLIGPTNRTVVDSSLIPCPTNNPSTNVRTSLYRLDDQKTEVLISDPAVVYHLTEGFRSSEVFSGDYICRQGQFSVPIQAVTSSKPSLDYEFSPISQSVRVFSSETIQFECFSKTVYSVTLVVPNGNPNLSISYEHKYNGMIARLSSSDPAVISSKGKVSCVVNDTETANRKTRVVKKWTFEFVQEPELFLDSFEGEINCLSQVTPKIVQTVRCINRMDCAFMSHCLEDKFNCNFRKQKQFFGEKSAICQVPNRESMECVGVPFSHFNGLVQCNVAGLVKTWDFFVSLNYIRYSDYKDVPRNELIRMDEVAPVLYTNYTTRFFCMAISYLFADSLAFEIEFKNGTIQRLKDNGNSVNISNPRSRENPQKISEFNVIGVLDIKLPLDTVKIECIAPCWNSTELVRTSRRFETRHLMEPHLLNGNSGDLKKQVFYLGERNQRLTCPAYGEPQPMYTWYFSDETLSTTFKNLTTSIGSNGEGHLEFPEIENKQYEGEYKCVANNREGTVELRFQLEIVDYPVSDNKLIYIVTIVSILVVLAFVLLLLYASKRKYMETKKLVRMLTDNEINEFFHGKPELLARENNVNGNSINFLPYNEKYEIPLKDLEFGCSEKLLGAGHCSYVVQGRIVSQSKPVAIKMSKPTADVELFKAMLSEVKIMIYIEKHPNIVTLVGVCTADIKNRMIYIVTDVCHLGSLDVYLLNSRTSFLNLINVNQKIDMSILRKFTTGDKSLSTLDLIIFSKQIAQGMEFLAYKNIIHADLAARNVLITTDKTAKISDFGLSRKLYELNNYVKKSVVPLPWRWMSIEALTSLSFSHASDSWAYGVTLFEIFTLGDKPFPNEQWNNEFVTRLSLGYRMGRPRYSTHEIYSKIMTCWENDPELRPNFTSLRTFFEQILHRHLNGTSRKKK